MIAERIDTTKYAWQKLSLHLLLEAISGVGVAKQCYGWLADHPENLEGVILEDDRVVLSASCWSGPYSDVTPDIDAEPPVHYLGTPSLFWYVRGMNKKGTAIGVRYGPCDKQKAIDTFKGAGNTFADIESVTVEYE